MAVKSSGDISAERVRGQKIEEHVVTNLDVRDDNNRPNLNSGAAEEREEVSLENTIDELSNAITGGKDIVSGHPIYRKKCGNIGWKTKSHF